MIFYWERKLYRWTVICYKPDKVLFLLLLLVRDNTYTTIKGYTKRICTNVKVFLFTSNSIIAQSLHFMSLNLSFLKYQSSSSIFNDVLLVWYFCKFSFLAVVVSLSQFYSSLWFFSYSCLFDPYDLKSFLVDLFLISATSSHNLYV